MFLDLGDLSQPENNAHLSGVEADLTDSESDVSVKDEEPFDAEPLETPYVMCDEEEFGGVSKLFFIFLFFIIDISLLGW